MILRDYPGWEVALDGVNQTLVGRTGILIHGNSYVITVLLNGWKSTDLV
jgi:hypothetical protein